MLSLQYPAFAVILTTVIACCAASSDDGALHLPIRRHMSSNSRKRDGGNANVGLGDYKDATYSVTVRIGAKDTPLVLGSNSLASLHLQPNQSPDTGSADVWVVSDACGTTCDTGVSLYPQDTFQSSGLDASLLYGDSKTGTIAFGLIGRDAMGLPGLSLPNQYFAAINKTTTTLLTAGAAGIFGLGFPLSSFIWYELHTKAFQINRHMMQPRDYDAQRFPQASYLRRRTISRFDRRQPPSTEDILASFAYTGPFMARLAMSGELAAPMFAVRLQRTTIDLTGSSNDGVLSLGALPAGVSNDSLTWAGVRRYTPAQQGLPPPADSPEELYPMKWEIYLDDVYFDGEKLPRSLLPKTDYGYSALLDTGSSLMRGPADVVAEIFARLGSSRFGCSTPHTLAFQIAGKLFPVDPRDFISPASPNATDMCLANVVTTDTPVEGQGYLHSWVLGDPFLKGVVAAFYFGNITYPSKDQPRVGLLSTVPPDASQRLVEAVASATADGKFPATSIDAPTGIVSSEAALANSSRSTSVAAYLPSSLPPSGQNHSRSRFSGSRTMTVFVGFLVSFLLLL